MKRTNEGDSKETQLFGATYGYGFHERLRRNRTNEMKVLLVNHGTASDWGGGDGVQIRETAKKLKQRGYEVEVQNSDQPNVEKFDIVHIFNCRVPNSFDQQINICKQANKPIIVSPIWINIGRALWGSRGTHALLRQGMNDGEESIKEGLELLKSRELKIQLDLGTIDAHGQGSYDMSWQKNVSRQIGRIDGLLPNSWLELKAVQTDLHWSGQKYDVAHYGVNPSIFLDADPKPFREHTGINGPFVLQAGRIEPAKNQAMLCWALQNTNIPIVLIGGSSHWPAYADLCKEIGGNNVRVIDHLPQNLLASAYAAARVHCLASWMDTCGLVSLEAGLAGTPLVGSTFGHELEYLKNDAWLADPACPKSLARAIEEAWQEKNHSEKSCRLKQRILADYNWENTAEKTIKMYKDIAGG